MRGLSREDGNVLVITALLATTLMGFAALTIDVGGLLVRRSSLQTGADAAALAIAHTCAEIVVETNVACTTSGVVGLAGQYFNDNRLDASTVTPLVTLRTEHGGRVGRVTVHGRSDQAPRLAGAIGFTDDQTVTATATARWGPLTAADAIFPLAICKGALPPIGQPFELAVDPADPTAYTDRCDGAPDAPSFSWLEPDDPELCTRKVTLLPVSYFSLLPSDNPPSVDGCPAEIDEVHRDVADTAGCHSTPTEGFHCHGSGDAEDRTRDVLVYDAAGGDADARPAYSLVAIEFTGTRFAGREEVSAGSSGWTDPACVPDDPTPIDDLQCIGGIVRAHISPTDGPIVDPELAALPGIDDSTVLDVRLAD